MISDDQNQHQNEDHDCNYEPDCKTYDRRHLRILQINLNKSTTAHYELMNSNAQHEWDIILVQEPYVHPTHKHIATPRGFRQVYPSAKAREGGTPRSGIWVSERLKTGSWNEVNVLDSKDVTGIKIRGDFGQLTIFNVYNDCNNDDSTTTLDQYIQEHRNEIYGTDKHVIWAGDFNRHHPMWDRDEDDRLFTSQATAAARDLIYMLSEWDMEMILPKGIPTLCHMRSKRESRPDNVFCTDSLTDRIVACNVRLPERCLSTDHYPIATIVNIDKHTFRAPPRPNFKEADWDKFQEHLETKLAGQDPRAEIRTEAEFNRRVEDLTKAMQDTVYQTVPRSRPSSYSRRWWDKDLEAMRLKKITMLKEARRFRAIPDHPIHQQLRQHMNRYAEAIVETKKAHWEAFLSDADMAALWMANRYLKSPAGDAGNPRLPPLERKVGNATVTVLTNEEKAEALGDIFFTTPPPPQPTLPPDDDAPSEHPTPLEPALPITEQRIHDHISRLAAHKAPGLDGIPNVVLKKCADHIASHLATIFNAVFELGVYHQSWKDSITCVLRKPGRPSYQAPKAYRPIALLSTIGKLLSAIVADDMSRLIEEHELLPETHFGGRPCRTTTDALHYIVNRVKSAWHKRRVVSILFLDVEGAFPNATTAKILHNMKKRRMPPQYVKLVENLLKNRRTKLKFDDFLSEFIHINNGIGQGCPLSMILYIIYNADMIEIPQGRDEDAVGYVDDIALVAEGDNLEETTEKLKDMMERPGGGLAWASTHNSKFEMSKVAIMHFSRKTLKGTDNTRTKQRVNAPNLTLQGTLIRNCETYKYLGVLFDADLNWKRQAENAATKGIKWVALFSRLSRTRKGINANLMRHLYRAVGIPKVTYAADVWYTPPSRNEGTRKTTGSVAALKLLQRMQRTAAIAITGAMRTTASDILDTHADLLPIDILLKSLRKRSFIRICTLPDTHPLRHQSDVAYQLRNQRCTQVNTSPLMSMARQSPIQPSKVEKIGKRKRPPTYIHPFNTMIEANRELSILHEQADKTRIKVYTDGSAINGGVGAAALLYIDDETEPREVLHYHLGPKTLYSTYDAEWVGTLMATFLLTKPEYSQEDHETASIYVDNQSVIKMATDLTPGPAQHIREAMLDIAEELRNQGTERNRFTLKWISAHSEVDRNERVDKEAKEAAAGKSSHFTRLPEKLFLALPISVSSLVQQAKAEAHEEWYRTWQKSPRKRIYDKSDNQFPARRYLKHVKKLSKKKSSILIQLRTQKIPLNEHLYKIKKAETDRCKQCQLNRRETVQHFLFDCPKYRVQRQKMDKAHKRNKRNLVKIFAKQQDTMFLLRYVESTQRFANDRTP